MSKSKIGKFNKNGVKLEPHEASEQSTRIIIDIRKIKHDHIRVEKDIIKRFSNKSTFRVMILIRKDGTVFEYRK